MNTSPLSFVLCLLFILSGCHGVRIRVLKRLQPFINRVYLECNGDGSGNLSGSALFHRSLGPGDSPQLVTPDPPNVGDEGSTPTVLLLYLTPSKEGVYTCTDDATNVTSSNSISLVAFPYLSSSFTLPQLTTVPIGATSPPLSCGFSLGSLPQYYEVEWWRGTSRLNTTAGNPKYSVQSDLRLRVNQANTGDASSAYYCKVIVRNELDGGRYENLSPDVGLQVYNPLVLNSSLTDTVLSTGLSASFTCTARGVPRPSIKWLIEGASPPKMNPRFSIQEQVNSSLTFYTITSTLSISRTETADSARIECVAVSPSSSLDDISIESDNTQLTIIAPLTDAPVLAVTQSGAVTLSIDFPTEIPILFHILIRYVSTIDTNNNYETVISSVSFSRIPALNSFNIPSNKLPTFSSFRAQIALSAIDYVGQYSQLSNAVSLDSPTPSFTPLVTTPSPSSTYGTSCSCDNTTSLYVVVSVLAVVLILLLVCMVMIIVMYSCRSRVIVTEPHITSYHMEERRVTATSTTNPLYSEVVGKTKEEAENTCNCSGSSSGLCTCNESRYGSHPVSLSTSPAYNGTLVPYHSRQTEKKGESNYDDIELGNLSNTDEGDTFINEDYLVSESKGDTTREVGATPTLNSNSIPVISLEDSLKKPRTQTDLPPDSTDKQSDTTEDNLSNEIPINTTSSPKVNRKVDKEEEESALTTNTNSISVQTSLRPLEAIPSYSQVTGAQKEQKDAPVSTDELAEWDMCEDRHK